MVTKKQMEDLFVAEGRDLAIREIAQKLMVPEKEVTAFLTSKENDIIKPAIDTTPLSNTKIKTEQMKFTLLKRRTRR